MCIRDRPSERAFAYKMKLEAIKNQGARSDLTSGQIVQKSKLSIEPVSYTHLLMAKAMNDQSIQPGEGVLHHAEGVDLSPANIELAGMEVSLVNCMNREKMLKQMCIRDRCRTVSP